MICFNILLNFQKIVKICWSSNKKIKQNTANYDIVTNQKNCRDITAPNKFNKKNIVALNIVTMKLMQKYTKNEKIIDVNDTNRWFINSHVVEFLSVIISATSISELFKVNLRMIIQQMNLTLLKFINQNLLKVWKPRVARFL